jgi:hypothetical protein
LALGVRVGCGYQAFQHEDIFREVEILCHKNRFALASRLWEDGSMTVGKGKRPRGPNQLAKWLVDNSTAEPAPAVPVPSDLSQYMAAMGRKGGQISGKRRLVTMTEEERRAAAVKAAGARWKKP